ncbi:MAG: NfeD family protein, partial [Verrucomicrobiota bacterium]
VIVHEAGNVLAMNTIEATEEIGGRAVLAAGVADSIEDLLKQEGIDAPIVPATRYGLESVASWVQKFSFVLIIIGLAGAYTEINSPGFGLPGLLSVVAFGIFFFGNYAAGNLAGYELAVLLVLGLALVAVEVFLFPGTILPGALGAALILFALGLAMVDRVDFQWRWSGFEGGVSWVDLFRSSFLSLAVGLVGALVLIGVAMRYLPETKAGSWLVLKQEVPAGASLDEAEDSFEGGSEKETTQSLVGATLLAKSDLVPSGKADHQGKLLDVMSDGGFVPKGSPLRVLRHEGSLIVVEADADAETVG